MGGTFNLADDATFDGDVQISGALSVDGAVTVVAGTITGITDLAIADGGTGASAPAAARTNLVVYSKGETDTAIAAEGEAAREHADAAVDALALLKADLRTQATVATDEPFTLTYGTSAEEQKHTGTLTADRLVTLATAGAVNGARFRLTRTGAGAFNLSLGGLKNLSTNSWAEAVYDGTAWYLAAAGTL